ncbi:hypothetical protein HFP70_35460 [Streptomyces sp. ARC14]|uniref:hypothetical protein n=1 Tax=Streptomyces sp. ARC14 TaxID=2724152 RepID=UPI003857B71E
MPTIDAAFFPVIVTARPHDDGYGHAYQQAPDGTDPGALRIVRADAVRPGDWYMGDCEQQTRARQGNRWGTHGFAAYPALPVHVDGAVAMEGQSPNWAPDELVMVIPREAIPAPARSYAVGDRVERPITHIPDPKSWFAYRPRAVIQRGTITAVDPDGMVMVAWAGTWAGTTIPDDAPMRHASAADLERERRTFGYAVGDPLTGEFGGGGTVVESWLHWWDGTPMLRVEWTGGTLSIETASRYAPAA